MADRDHLRRHRSALKRNLPSPSNARNSACAKLRLCVARWCNAARARRTAIARGRHEPVLTSLDCFTPCGAAGPRDTREGTKDVCCATNTPKRLRHRRCARKLKRAFSVPARHMFTTQRAPDEPQSTSSSSSITSTSQLAWSPCSRVVKTSVDKAHACSRRGVLRTNESRPEARNKLGPVVELPCELLQTVEPAAN